MTYHPESSRAPRARLALALALPLLVGGCNNPGTNEEPALAAPPPRPETREAIIEIEGTQERFTFRLFESPPDFPVRFSTYVPPDMIAEASREGEAGSVRFVANFGGLRNDLAVLHFFFYPEGVSEEQARAELQTFATSRGVPRSIEDPEASQQPERVTGEQLYDWAHDGFRFSMERPEGVIVGTAALGWHRGRFFHVVRQYPEEYGDGFGPRAEWIIRDWRWEETGEPLGGPGAAPGIPPVPGSAPE